MIIYFCKSKICMICIFMLFSNEENIQKDKKSLDGNMKMQKGMKSNEHVNI